MEVGFSILMKEFIKAADCDYHSTSDYQIRCPFCFEPLFLKRGTKMVPHFSHYDISLNAKTCELRAKSVNFYFEKSDITEGKGQTLLQHYFVFANCFALFMGIPANNDFSILNKTFNQQQIDNIKFYTLDEIKRLNKHGILPEDYLGKFIESNIKFYLYKLNMESILEKKDAEKIKQEFVKSFFFFTEEYNNHHFNFVESGIEYRRNNTFYNNFEESAKPTLPQIIEEKSETIKQLLKVAFNDLEIKEIFSILKLSDKNPCYSIAPNMIPFIENDIFETNEKKSISLKKILLFLGQENYFLYKRKELGSYNIARIKDVDDLSLRLSLIMNFSGRQTKDNLFYKYFPAITNKLILIHEPEFKIAKNKYLTLIKKLKKV